MTVRLFLALGPFLRGGETAHLQNATMEAVPLPSTAETKTAPDFAPLDEMGPSAIVRLVAADGKSFEVSRQAASISSMVSTALLDPHATEVQCAQVFSPTLALVAEYMRHHNGKEAAPPKAPLRSNDMTVACEDVWDAEFVDRIAPTRQPLYDLIHAAVYMGVPVLAEICGAKIATFIRGTSPLCARATPHPRARRVAGVPPEKIKVALDPVQPPRPTDAANATGN